MKGNVCFLFLIATLVGCGDDDGGGDATESGVPDGSIDLGRDAGRDTGAMDPDARPRDMSVPDDGTRRDMFVPPPPDDMRDCSPAEDMCPDGSKCALVIEQTEAGEDLFYTRCVPDGTRSGGSRCSFSVEVPDAPTVSADTCVRGFFCGTDAEHRFPTCLPYCASGSDCTSGSICAGIAQDVNAGACLAFDRCDPVYQLGCRGGENCYVIADDVRSATTCAPFDAEGGTGDGSFGDECTFVNNCAAGLTCAADVGPDGMPTMTRHCRPYCDTSLGGRGGGGTDGGTVDGGATDAGAPSDSGAADAGLDGAGAVDGSIDGALADDAGADVGPLDAGPAPDAGSPFSGRCPEGVGLCLPFVLGIDEEPPAPIGVCRE